MKALRIVTIASLFFITSIAVASDVSSVNKDAKDSTAVTTVDTDEALFIKLEKVLINNLNSDVPGVVESSIFNAIHYKVEYPKFSSERVEQILSRIAANGESHSLRYKAYLSLAYYTNQDQFDSPESLLSLLDFKYKDGIFFYLQDTVQSVQFTSNIN